jgi:hypothetical protein
MSTLTHSSFQRPHHYGSKNRPHHHQNRNRNREPVGHGIARCSRQSLSVALSSFIQTGNRNESGSICEGFSSAKSRGHVADELFVRQTDPETGWSGFQRALRPRLSKDVRHDSDCVSTRVLACSENKEVEEEATKRHIASFVKI